MTYEPDFNRLRTALFGGQPDRVPLFELHISKSLMEPYLGRKIITLQDEIDFLLKAGYDFIKLSPIIDMNPGKTIPKDGSRISEATDRADERSWHSSGQGKITSVEDFEKFRWPQPNEVDYSPFEKIQDVLPSGMKIIGQYGDIFTWVWDFMGFETFSFALIDNEELIRLMFDKVGTIVLNLFENMVSLDNIGALFYTDDIAINTGLFVSPDVYRKYLFSWMKKIGRLCRDNDIPLIFHSDGNLWAILEDIKACGVNAIHPIEPQAMDIREVKQKYGHIFCLNGNVDVDVLSRATPEEVREIVKGLLRDIAPGGGFCLGSGNSVPEYAQLKNYTVMVKTAHQFGAYPISV